MQMFQWFRFPLRTVGRYLPECLLLACWACGCWAGILTGSNAGVIYLSLMRGALGCSVSIVGLAFSVFLPFLLSAFAVYWNRPRFLYIISFVKAWSFTFAAYGICQAFGSAGWLVRFLVQFSDICLLCPLCWFLLRHIRSGSQLWRRDLEFCTLAAAAVCSIDYCVVSPFVVALTQT